MSYRSYQPTSSPWTSGVPPGAPPPAMYGHPHHNAPPHQHHGPPGYNVAAAYGSPNNALWAGRHPMGPSAGWGQSNPALAMGPNQRGNMRGNVGGPTGKRAGGAAGNWNEGPPVKRMNKGGNRGAGGAGNWRNAGFGNRRDNQKFGNRSFNRDNRKNKDGKGKAGDQNDKKQQQEFAHKAVDSLENNEYPVIILEDGSTLKAEDKPKLEELDTAHGRYLTGVFGFCCKLCNIFLRDKVSRLEHYQKEEHLEKFNAAEKVRIQEEKEEAERKAKEEEEKAAQAALKAKTNETSGTTDEDKIDETVNGDVKAEGEQTNTENGEGTDEEVGNMEEANVTNEETMESTQQPRVENLEAKVHNVSEQNQVANSTDKVVVGENASAAGVIPTIQQETPSIVREDEESSALDQDSVDGSSAPVEEEVSDSMKTIPLAPINVTSSPRGGRGSPRGRTSTRATRGRGPRGRGGSGRNKR